MCVQNWTFIFLKNLQRGYGLQASLLTAISRKVVGKSARDNPVRHCGWFWVLFFSKKFERICTKGHGNVFASAKGKQQKIGSTATVVRNSVLIISHIRDGPLEKLWGGGWGIFELQQFFFRCQIPCMNFFQVVAWIFFGVNLRAWVFFHLIFPCANIFFVVRAPPHKFSNGPSLIGIVACTFFLTTFLEIAAYSVCRG